MLNKNTIKVGQHLICVVLEDLLKIQNDTSLCLSLNNQRISGRLQLPSTLLIEQEIQSFDIDDDKFVVLGTAAIIRFCQRSIESQARRQA